MSIHPLSSGRTILLTADPVAVVGVLTTLLSGCEGTVTYYDPPPPEPPAPIVYNEGEPNDWSFEAPWFGSLLPGEDRFVAGWSTDDGSDPQDGLAFTAYGPLRIDFVLHVDDPFADLDVWLYDPTFDSFVAAFDAPFGDEKGTFWMSDYAADFHLVVLSAYGSSHWTLEVVASGGSGAVALQAEPTKPPPPSLEHYLRTGRDRVGLDTAAESAAEGSDGATRAVNPR